MLLQTTGSDALDKAKGTVDAVTQSAKGLERATKLADISLQNLASTMGKMLLPAAVIQDVDKLRELTYDMTRQGLGQTKLVGDAIADTMAEATFETLQFGVGLDDNLNLMKAMNDSMRTNTLLTSEQVVNMQAIANNAGITGAELAPIVEGFRSIGVGTDKAIENISDMSEQARNYGVNVGEFMKGVASNIKMMSSYNFKDGVDGFSKMVMKAQALRIDVGKTFTMAEGLLEPEKAIEMAANFQMLGGAVGDLGDPFKLLHMAQTDVEGLQDAVLGMAESAVSFNEKTGEFDISTTEMYRLKEAAGAVGMSYTEMTDMAMKAAERTKKLDMLGGLSEIDDDKKELLASMGNIKGGEIEVQIPVFNEAGKQIEVATKKAQDLNKADFATLEKMQTESAMSDKEIAVQNMGYLETIANTVASADFAPVMLGTNTKGVTDAQEAFKAVADEALLGLNEAFSADEVAEYGRTLTRHIAEGMNSEEAAEDFQDQVGRMGQALIDIPQIMFDKANEKLDEENLLKDLKLDEIIVTKLEEISTSFLGVGESLINAFPPAVADQIKEQATAVSGGLILVGDALEYVLGRNIDKIMSGSQDNSQDNSQQPNPSSNTVPSSLPINPSSNTVPSTLPIEEPEEQDFILRPGMDPVSFRKDDLILGGTKLFDAVNSINGMGGNMDTANAGSVNGNVKLDVGGKIDLSVDGKNLPQNISSEQLAMEIVNNPNFTSKLISIFTDSNNTYSV